MFFGELGRFCLYEFVKLYQQKTKAFRFGVWFSYLVLLVFFTGFVLLENVIITEENTRQFQVNSFMYEYLDTSYLLAFLPITLLAPIALLNLKTSFASKSWLVAVFGYTYICFTFLFAIEIAIMGEALTATRAYLLLNVFFLIWTFDIGAYFVGKNLGKTKLAPTISPKKTWEGFAGGLFFSLIVAYWLAPDLDILDQFGMSLLSTRDFMVFALIAAIFGTSGDLLESRFKRWVGVKDSSNLLPGHGGFLDRFDAFMMVVPVIYGYLCIAKF